MILINDKTINPNMVMMMTKIRRIYLLLIGKSSVGISSAHPGTDGGNEDNDDDDDDDEPVGKIRLHIYDHLGYCDSARKPSIQNYKR